MTIDSRITVRASNSKDRIINEPPYIDLKKPATQKSGYDERLFLCPKKDQAASFGAQFYSKNGCPNRPQKPKFIAKISDNFCPGYQPGLDKKLCKCLALKGKFYYNNVLYVVGPWLVQGVAKLRKVAEVFITDFNYLKLPHITNSNRTVVAK